MNRIQKRANPKQHTCPVTGCGVRHTHGSRQCRKHYTNKNLNGHELQSGVKSLELEPYRVIASSQLLASAWVKDLESMKHEIADISSRAKAEPPVDVSEESRPLGTPRMYQEMERVFFTAQPLEVIEEALAVATLMLDNPGRFMDRNAFLMQMAKRFFRLSYEHLYVWRSPSLGKPVRIRKEPPASVRRMTGHLLFSIVEDTALRLYKQGVFNSISKVES